jgi:putative aldouronate transport system permease protein
MPTIAVLILYYAVDRWNSWFFASILLKDRKLYPLQLVLREILLINDTGAMAGGSDNADMQMLAESIKYAAIVIGTVPILGIYPFLQRYFVKGALIGAVKE